MNSRQFYIDGAWVDPLSSTSADLKNPTTEAFNGKISMGSSADVDRAVVAARRAFPSFASSSVEERVALLSRIADLIEMQRVALTKVIVGEIGAPAQLAWDIHTAASIEHFRDAARVLSRFAFETGGAGTRVAYEAIGVCGLITPWNWPLNQITSKLATALAAGCTVVLKPSEFSSLSALMLAQLLDDAGVPKGVFNLVNGDGETVGQAIAAHRDVDMVSFTGSTRAGILVAKAAADTVKRVHQELGGKSASIVLPDADLGAAVVDTVRRCFLNSGQSCIAPSRMLVHGSQSHEARRIAKDFAETVVVGHPDAADTMMGPLAGEAQFKKVQGMIAAGLDEGATLVTGGLGRPEGLDVGFYTRPTIFADVSPTMTIAREEIFGPVLSIMTYDDETEALQLANDTVYGLAGYVYSQDSARAKRAAGSLRAGLIYINNPPFDFGAPFGGYKQSGNGRELGEHGLREYLEVKAVFGS